MSRRRWHPPHIPSPRERWAERVASRACERAGIPDEIGDDPYAEIAWKAAVETVTRLLLRQRDDLIPTARLGPITAIELRARLHERAWRTEVEDAVRRRVQEGIDDDADIPF